MKPMTSMELDDEQKLDAAMPMPMAEAPKYPYGLRISLTEAECEKLGCDPSEAFVGGIVHIHGLARITSVSANEHEHGMCHRIELQIEDMAVEGEDAENKQANRSMRKRSPLYDRS